MDFIAVEGRSFVTSVSRAAVIGLCKNAGYEPGWDKSSSTRRVDGEGDDDAGDVSAVIEQPGGGGEPEDEVRGGLDVLQAYELVSVSRDARVPKYEHRIRTVLNLRRDETAVLCLLLLRGAQTVGELRSRSDRMFSFDDIAAVQTTLERLTGRETALTAVLPRVPGAREVRWMHLLGVEGIPAGAAGQAASIPVNGAVEDDLAGLRREIAALEERVRALEER